MLWLLQFLTDWVYYGILLVGIVGLAVTYLLRFIPLPAIYVYRTPIQLASVAMIAFGVYMSGVIANEAKWKERVVELEKKVSEAEAKSQKVNNEVVIKYVTKTQVVKEKGEEVIKYIDREVVKIDDSCKLSHEAVKAHNEAVKDRK